MAEPGAKVDSLERALEWLRKHFDAEASKGLRVAYCLVLSGPGGGACHARVDDGRLEAGPGPVEPADVTLHLEARDFFAVLDGRANADLLFMRDRIRIEGDLGLALKLRRIFG